MRIGLVTDTYTPQVNGVSTVLRRIAATLENAGHGVAVVAPRYPGHAAPPNEMRAWSVPFPPYPAIRLAPPRQRRIAAFLDEFRPHVVHVATEGPLGAAGRRWAMRRGIPLMTSFHTNFPMYCRHYGAPWLEGTAWRWIRHFHAPARIVHAPGAAARAALHERGLTQTVVWGTGVDSGLFHHRKRDLLLRRELGIADDEVAVLHVGRLASEKNIATMVEAFALAHDALGSRARFVIAGEGPREGLIRRAAPFAIRLGFLPTERLAAVYASADICVLTSETETCGLVALEAMASGLAVIAADAGGFRENVAHGRTGRLVAPRDPRGFACAIVELALDDQRRHALGAAARVAAVGRDVTLENAALLDQYAGLAGLPVEQDAWRAA